MRCAPFAAIVAITLAGLSAGAQQRPLASPYGSPRIDPRFELLFAHRARTGTTFPMFARSTRFEREGSLPVVIRFATPPSQSLIAALAVRGVAFHFGGRPMISGGYSARVDATGLAALAAEPSVVHVACDLPARNIRPLDLSVLETRIDSARRAARLMGGDDLDGHGVIIGDLDTSVFVFHPALFRADGGISPWIDVNHDGVLTAGVDGIDVDRDGQIAPEETLRLLHESAFDVYGNPWGSRGGPFRPDADWLYLDTNGDHARNYGSSFQETDPAYGEPIFVADDANHDGRVQVSEHLLRLGTSKFRAVMDNFEYTRGDTTGSGLVAYDLGDDDMAYQTSFHGTGVAGILASGVPGVTRLLGLAPGADLVVADTDTAGNTMGATGAMQWEVDRGVGVMLTEFAQYVFVSLDGSSEEELFLDSALMHNVVPVSPAGNLAQSNKHRSLTLMPGDNTVMLPTAEGFDGATVVLASIHFQDPSRRLTLQLDRPEGGTVTFPANAPMGVAAAGGGFAFSMDTITSRGTHEQHVGLQSTHGLSPGTYVLHLSVPGTTPLAVDVYVGDDKTSWGGGFEFADNDDARTLCHPATSDHTLAVAAYVLHDDAAYGPWGMAGELAGYSSRGPRLDGMAGISIAAPDNPLSLVPARAGSVPAGSYAPFGGTSGAGPHVAASVALLRQRFPDETPSQIRERLVTHARHDANATADAVTRFGAGKLDLSAAIELDAPTGTPPTVVLGGPDEVVLGDDAMLTPQVNDTGSPDTLRLRWDVDYDGHPDTDWMPVAPHSVHAAALGPLDVRVEVRNANGYLAAATHRVMVVRMLSVGDGGVDARADASAPIRVIGGRGCACVAGAGAPGGRGPMWLLALAASAAITRRRGRRVTRS